MIMHFTTVSVSEMVTGKHYYCHDIIIKLHQLCQVQLSQLGPLVW